MIFSAKNIFSIAIVVSYLSMPFAAIAQVTEVPLLVNYKRTLTNPSVLLNTGEAGFFALNRTNAYQKYKLFQAGCFSDKYMSGAGLQVENYQSLLENITAYRLGLAYRIRFADSWCQFGFAPQLMDYHFNTDNLTIRTPHDALAPGESLRDLSTMYNAGVFIRKKRLSLGLDIQNIALKKRKGNLGTGFPNTTCSIYSSYQIKLSDSWQYEPSVYYRYNKAWSFAALSNQLTFHRISAAFQYGSFANWSAVMAFSYPVPGRSALLYAGYALSSGHAGLTKHFSHEVFVSLTFNKLSRENLKEYDNLPSYKSPVYF